MRAPRKPKPGNPFLVCGQYARGWTATGTREQLLAAGLCTPAHFPEGRKRRSGGMVDGRWWILTAERGGRWKLLLERTPKEVAALQIATAVREDAERCIEFLQTMTADDRRGNALADLESGAKLILNRLNGDCVSSAGSGFVFGADVMRQVERHLSLIAQLVASAPIAFDADRQKASIEEQKRRLGDRDSHMPKLRAPLRLVA